MTIVVTGAAGFIGRAVCERLLDRGDRVLGIDNFNSYYDPQLKEDRIRTLAARKGFELVRMDIAEADVLAGLVAGAGCRRMIHLAAQAGVRYSLENPFAYERSNLLGHLSVLEACRHAPAFEHLVYASSSSVYGERMTAGGFREDEVVDRPVSLYAATKLANELMSASYSHLYGLRQSGLRFFTVYGPWGRPDMAYFSFTQKIVASQPIEVFGQGQMARDFTYIDDIVSGIVGVLDSPPAEGESRVLNIGNSRPEGLMDMISTLERELGVESVKVYKPMQPGDVSQTFANIDKIRGITGYSPATTIDKGLSEFVKWYRSYYSDR